MNIVTPRNQRTTVAARKAVKIALILALTHHGLGATFKSKDKHIETHRKVKYRPYITLALH